MYFLDQSTYAFREFYARNSHLAPNPRFKWRRLVVCGAILLFGTGAATGAYVLSAQLHQDLASQSSWVAKAKSFFTSITAGHITIPRI